MFCSVPKPVLKISPAPFLIVIGAKHILNCITARWTVLVYIASFTNNNIMWIQNGITRLNGIQNWITRLNVPKGDEQQMWKWQHEWEKDVWQHPGFSGIARPRRKILIENVDGMRNKSTFASLLREICIDQSAWWIHVSCKQSNQPQTANSWTSWRFSRQRMIKRARSTEVGSLNHLDACSKMSIGLSIQSDETWTGESSRWNLRRQAFPTGQEKTKCHSESSHTFCDRAQQERQARLWLSDSLKPRKEL